MHKPEPEQTKELRSQHTQCDIILCSWDHCSTIASHQIVFYCCFHFQYIIYFSINFHTEAFNRCVFNRLQWWTRTLCSSLAPSEKTSPTGWQAALCMRSRKQHVKPTPTTSSSYWRKATTQVHSFIQPSCCWMSYGGWGKKIPPVNQDGWWKMFNFLFI